MNCPGCGAPLMGNMKICPKCKYNIQVPEGGPEHKAWKCKMEQKAEIEKAERERQKAAFEQNMNRFKGEGEIVYHINGCRGRVIDIYPYKCVISTDVTVGSVITKNATDGEKTLYFQDCIGLQVKYSGLTIGFVQFETASPSANNLGSNFFNENTFTFENTQVSNEEMKIVVDYIKGQLDKIKEAQRKSWNIEF